VSDIFLCYASEDASVAERIQLSLTAAGYNVFFDEHSLPPGGDFHARIEQAIARCDLFVFLISKASVAPGKFTLTELKLARQRWPNPIGHVLAVNLEDLPADRVPAYLSTATFASVEGNAAAEVRVAVEEFMRSAKPRKPRSKALTLSLAVGSMAVVLTITIGRWNAPSAPPQEIVRLLVRAISLESQPDGLHASAHMTVTNMGSKSLLVDSLRVGVVGVPREGNVRSVVWYDPLKAVPLAADESRPIELVGDRITSWNYLGNPAPSNVDFATHRFEFWLQLQATVGATGQRVWLDLEAPQPNPMNCKDARPCVAVYDINVPAGATPYKKCTALPVNRGFELACSTRDLP